MSTWPPCRSATTPSRGCPSWPLRGIPSYNDYQIPDVGPRTQHSGSQNATQSKGAAANWPTLTRTSKSEGITFLFDGESELSSLTTTRTRLPRLRRGAHMQDLCNRQFTYLRSQPTRSRSRAPAFSYHDDAHDIIFSHRLEKSSR